MYIRWLFWMLSIVNTTTSILISSNVYLVVIWNVVLGQYKDEYTWSQIVYTHQCKLLFCHESYLRPSEKYNLRRDINAQAMSVNTINVALHILTKLIGRKWGDFNERSELQKYKYYYVYLCSWIDLLKKVMLLFGYLKWYEHKVKCNCTADTFEKRAELFRTVYFFLREVILLL